MSNETAVTAPCRMRAMPGLNGHPSLSSRTPRRRYRVHRKPGPHLVTIAKRPSGRAGMVTLCHKSEIR